MKLKFEKTFTSYEAAVRWLEANGYDQSALEEKWIVTLEGRQAERALKEASKVKVVQQEAR